MTAVPEPQTYALMTAGLGVIGWFARRRRTG
ncbi:MAG: PEP-CTERM sorting domain-containing protein [Burkholderiales bacterium]